MIVNKITSGFVIQQYNTITKQFLSQEFVAGNKPEDVKFENEFGEPVKPFNDNLNFVMKQPKNKNIKK